MYVLIRSLILDRVMARAKAGAGEMTPVGGEAVMRARDVMGVTGSGTGP